MAVAFTSPQGNSIQLAQIGAGNLTPEDFLGANQLPNTRCANSTNAHSLAVRLCQDTLAGTRTGEFAVELPAGTKELLGLFMPRFGDARVFEAMVASVRLAP